MSFLQTVGKDAAALIGFLSKAQTTASHVDLPPTLAAISDLIKNPKQALVDGSMQTVLYTADDILGAIAMIPEPAAPSLMAAAGALGAFAAVEPDIAYGAEILFASGLIKIPQVTLDTESNIEDQLGPEHGSRG